MRTMTDNEFQRLKGLLHKKIIEVDALRKLYREQTGQDYVLSGNLPEPEDKEINMNTDIRLEIRLEALITEREGMWAENIHRINCGYSIAYGDESFFDLAKRIRTLSDQKPLTKDQITDLNEKHGYFDDADAQRDVTLAFVRDIEKIHGIKESL